MEPDLREAVAVRSAAYKLDTAAEDASDTGPASKGYSRCLLSVSDENGTRSANSEIVTDKGGRIKGISSSERPAVVEVNTAQAADAVPPGDRIQVTRARILNGGLKHYISRREQAQGIIRVEGERCGDHQVRRRGRDRRRTSRQPLGDEGGKIEIASWKGAGNQHGRAAARRNALRSKCAAVSEHGSARCRSSIGEGDRPGNLNDQAARPGPTDGGGPTRSSGISVTDEGIRRRPGSSGEGKVPSSEVHKSDVATVVSGGSDSPVSDLGKLVVTAAGRSSLQGDSPIRPAQARYHGDVT